MHDPLLLLTRSRTAMIIPKAHPTPTTSSWLRLVLEPHSWHRSEHHPCYCYKVIIAFYPYISAAIT